MSALLIVGQYGELTLGELATIERITPASMTRIAAFLEQKGLLERRPDSSDRRVARVALSDAGQKLLKVHRERSDAFVAARMARLTEQEQDLLAQAVPLLEKLTSEDPARTDR
jgi:DNA-binding MarR family transcriptional regulator